MSKLDISFNSPQCGWMSIGFSDGESEFHTTTAHAPHELALPELMAILAALSNPASKDNEYLLRWNRDPEEFDFRFVRNGDQLHLEIYEFPSNERETRERKLVFSHIGTVADICSAFAETFRQLYDDRTTDEFEFNWRQPFPETEYNRFIIATTSVASH